MTKKIVWAFLITSLAFKGFSQNNSWRFIEEPKVPEEEIKKNEAGFNTATFIAVVLGTQMYQPKLSLSYKRIVKERNAIRFSINGLPKTYLGSTHEHFYIISQTDSTQLRRNYQNINGNKYQGNIGYERRKGKKKFKCFLGADLIFGHSGERRITYDESYSLEKTFDGKDTLYQFRLDSTAAIAFTSTRFFYTGISPFIGLNFSISKRFALSVQTGADMSFSIGKMKTKDYIKNETTETRISTFNFNMDGLVNDLSIVYRF